MDQPYDEFINSVSGLPLFLIFAATCLVCVALFIFIYTLVTPHRELELVRDGNTAAALSLGGAVVGFVIPLGQAVIQSVNLVDMAIWAAIALVVQLAVFGLTTMVLGGASKRIAAGDMAAGCFLALMAVAGGILNASSMTYID